MRESNHSEYEDVIPEEWHPKSHDQYLEMLLDPNEYFFGPLYTAMTVDDSDSLLRIWNETNDIVRVRALGNLDKMRELVIEGEPWKRKQFEGLICTVWDELKWRDVETMVAVMREGNDKE